MTHPPISGRGAPYTTDNEAFQDHAEASFPWIRVVFGEVPDIPRTAWVYYLQANGKCFKKPMPDVTWYRGPPRWRKPAHTRPIAYIIVNKDFEMNETVFIT